MCLREKRKQFVTDLGDDRWKSERLKSIPSPSAGISKPLFSLMLGILIEGISCADDDGDKRRRLL
jgi:hypothetical protein